MGFVKIVKKWGNACLLLLVGGNYALRVDLAHRGGDLLNLVKRVLHHSLSSHVDIYPLSHLQSFYSLQQLRGLFFI